MNADIRVLTHGDLRLNGLWSGLGKEYMASCEEGLFIVETIQASFECRMRFESGWPYDTLVRNHS